MGKVKNVSEFYLKLFSLHYRLNNFRKVGVVYDISKNGHLNLWDSSHIEKPERVNAILERCQYYNLFDKCSIIQVIDYFHFYAPTIDFNLIILIWYFLCIYNYSF